MAEQKVIPVGQWSIGLDRKSGSTILRFDFTDAPPIMLLVPSDEAQKLADAIRDQYDAPPPARLS